MYFSNFLIFSKLLQLPLTCTCWCFPVYTRSEIGAGQVWNECESAAGWNFPLCSRSKVSMAARLTSVSSFFKTGCLQDCLLLRLPVFKAACLQDYLSSRLPAFKTTCLQGCLPSRRPVFKAACLQDYLSSRLSVFKAEQLIWLWCNLGGGVGC